MVAEQAYPGLLDDRQVLAPVVHEVDRDLGDLSGDGAGRVEGAAEVGVDLARLGGQVTRTDQVAVDVLGSWPAMNTILVPVATTTWV